MAGGVSREDLMPCITAMTTVLPSAQALLWGFPWVALTCGEKPCIYGLFSIIREHSCAVGAVGEDKEKNVIRKFRFFPLTFWRRAYARVSYYSILIYCWILLAKKCIIFCVCEKKKKREDKTMQLPKNKRFHVGIPSKWERGGWENYFDLPALFEFGTSVQMQFTSERNWL